MAFASRKQAVARILPDSGEMWSGFGMPVVLVASPVGGAGCSTLAVHLAVEAGRTGYGPTLLLDATPGAAVVDWLKRRNRQTPDGQAIGQPILAETIQGFEKQGYQLCIIDAKVAFPSSSYLTEALADLVVIPCILEDSTLAAAADFARAVRADKGIATVVITQATQGQAYWNDVTRDLKKEGLLSPAVLHRDDTVGAAMIQGLTAGEAQAGAVADADIRLLWKILARALPHPPRHHRWMQGRGRAAQRGLRSTGRAKTVFVANRDAILAANLGAQSIRSGMDKDSVVLIGRKGSAWDRWERSGGWPMLSLKMAGSRQLPEEIVKVGLAGARLCIVEIETADIDRLTAEGGLADLVIVPVDPVTCLDRREFERFEALARQPGLVFVLDTSADKRAVYEARAALLAAGGQIAGKRHLDETFTRAWAEGKTVMEYSPESRAAREIVELWAALRRSIKL